MRRALRLFALLLFAAFIAAPEADAAASRQVDFFTKLKAELIAKKPVRITVRFRFHGLSASGNVQPKDFWGYAGQQCTRDLTETENIELYHVLGATVQRPFAQELDTYWEVIFMGADTTALSKMYLSRRTSRYPLTAAEIDGRTGSLGNTFFNWLEQNFPGGRCKR